jgi:HEAT repeat protein
VLLDLLGGEEQVSHAVEALVKSESKEERGRILSYLRLVGPAAAISILRVLDRVESSELLDALADVVADGATRQPEMVEDLSGLSGRSVSALLRASNALPATQRSALIWAGSSHGEPEVRLSVLELLAGFGPGHADTIVVNALRDSNSMVREKAVAMAGARKVAAALPVISRLVRAREHEEMSPEFLGALLTSYARIGGAKVLSDLVRILNHSPKLTDLRRSTQLQMDAALAISTIDDDAAREHLKKGAKSLNPALRKACKDALAAVSHFGMSGPPLNLPLLGPRVESTLPTEVAAPARSSAPPPPMSSPPSRSPPPPMPSSFSSLGDHDVAPQHRSEAMPTLRRAPPIAPTIAELPMDALKPIEPTPARRASIPPPSPKRPSLDLSADLSEFIDMDD